MYSDILNALMGGAVIGIAVSLMLLWNGRVTGISGIVGGALTPKRGDFLWRLLFVVGLFLGGVFLRAFFPAAIESTFVGSQERTIVAGLLVGFGTLLGSGCTSGHGVCGISRMSKRSLVATAVFISAGVLSVAIFRMMGVVS